MNAVEEVVILTPLEIRTHARWAAAEELNKLRKPSLAERAATDSLRQAALAATMARIASGDAAVEWERVCIAFSDCATALMAGGV